MARKTTKVTKAKKPAGKAAGGKAGDSFGVYRAKRDFGKSPEPSGEAGDAGGKVSSRIRKGRRRYFCVQKHLASSLHYDLRLEHEGVLLSWAVPKGPSLDPGDKRLAMKVEDHPLDYGDFEGVIPEGYGAGIVMLWDFGRWRPVGEDVGAALEKGEVKFELEGYKLKGSWVIVRTGRNPDRRRAAPGSGRAWGGRSWLLIKHRDEWAGEVDITAFAPDSVKSNRTFAEILAAEKPEVWESDRPAKGGAAGGMLREIIEEAARIKARRGAGRGGSRAGAKRSTKKTKEKK
jgi:bifunctional non-homologous end joining protein LigD